MTEPAVRFQQVSKTYRHGMVDVVAVRDLDVALEHGTVTAITGSSGSGKSTLLHLAAGLVQPTAGSVRIGGTDLAGRSPAELAALRRTKVGVVFQQYNLVPSLTALENVTLPLEYDGLDRREATRLASEALERVGVPEPHDRYPDDLSGGQQQRIAIARAVAVPRDVVLADEPTGALDTVTGDRIMDLLVGLADDGAAVVIVTHEPRVASHASRVVTLRDGRRVGDTGAMVTADLDRPAPRAIVAQA